MAPLSQPHATGFGLSPSVPRSNPFGRVANIADLFATNAPSRSITRRYNRAHTAMATTVRPNPFATTAAAAASADAKSTQDFRTSLFGPSSSVASADRAPSLFGTAACDANAWPPLSPLSLPPLSLFATAQSHGTGDPPYSPVVETNALLGPVRYLSICAMPAYAHKSPEELRYEDRVTGRAFNRSADLVPVRATSASSLFTQNTQSPFTQTTTTTTASDLGDAGLAFSFSEASGSNATSRSEQRRSIASSSSGFSFGGSTAAPGPTTGGAGFGFGLLSAAPAPLFGPETTKVSSIYGFGATSASSPTLEETVSPPLLEHFGAQPLDATAMRSVTQ